MDENEIKRIAFIEIQKHLQEAKDICDNVEELKELFSDKIEDLLEEIGKEMMNQQIY